VDQPSNVFSWDPNYVAYCTANGEDCIYLDKVANEWHILINDTTSGATSQEFLTPTHWVLSYNGTTMVHFDASEQEYVIYGHGCVRSSPSLCVSDTAGDWGAERLFQSGTQVATIYSCSNGVNCVKTGATLAITGSMSGTSGQIAVSPSGAISFDPLGIQYCSTDGECLSLGSDQYQVRVNDTFGTLSEETMTPSSWLLTVNGSDAMRYTGATQELVIAGHGCVKSSLSNCGTTIPGDWGAVRLFQNGNQAFSGFSCSGGVTCSRTGGGGLLSISGSGATTSPGVASQGTFYSGACTGGTTAPIGTGPSGTGPLYLYDIQLGYGGGATCDGAFFPIQDLSFSPGCAAGKQIICLISSAFPLAMVPSPSTPETVTTIYWASLAPTPTGTAFYAMHYISLFCSCV
jgi:hypothetical protein